MLPPPRKAYAWIAPVWTLCLIAGSLLPYETKLAIGTRPRNMVNPRAPVVTLKHRGFHWLSFASTALILLLLARNRHQELTVTLGVVALGCSLEFAQHALYRNDIEWWDMRDDAYGAVAALVLVQFPAVKRSLVR